MPVARRKIEAIAEYHAIGGNGPSSGDVGRLVVAAFAKIPPEEFFRALAALRPFQASPRAADLLPIAAKEAREP